MKILIVSQYFWPENFRINALSEFLAGEGHAVTVLTGQPNYPEGVVFGIYKDNPSKFREFKGVEIHRVKHLARGKTRLGLILNYLSFCLSACFVGPFLLRKCSFDVIFVFEPSPIFIGIPAMLLKQLKRAPIAFWVLDLWPETLAALQLPAPRIFISAIGWLAGKIYRSCDLILVQSRNFIAPIVARGGRREDIRYFPNWAEPFREVEKKQEIGIRFPENPDKFNIVFAGNMGEAQDLPAILSAIELSRSHFDINWLFVGEGRKLSWFKTEIERLSLEDSVFIYGRLSSEKMPTVFEHADALLVSLQDKPVFDMTVPAKVQSYLAAGKPILAMIGGASAEIISQSHAGYVANAGDAVVLAKNAIALSKLPRLEQKKMGMNGKAAAERHFKSSALFHQLSGWLSELEAVKLK